MRKLSIMGLLGLSLACQGVNAEYDFSQVVERLLKQHSQRYFGISGPLRESAKGTVVRKPGQDAGDLIKLAKGMHSEILTRDAGHSADMFSFWSNEDTPTHLIFCIEGEVICGVESDPLYEPPALDSEEPVRATVVVNQFVEGDADFNSVDNLAFQPTTGIVYVIEDHDNGDIFACLPDGLDRDIKSDGCVKILSVRDQSAEPTGFAVEGDGITAYLAIQHSRR